MKPLGVEITMPLFIYPLFKRLFWRHINGTIIDGRWAHSRVVWKRLA